MMCDRLISLTMCDPSQLTGDSQHHLAHQVRTSVTGLEFSFLLSVNDERRSLSKLSDGAEPHLAQ